MAPLQDATPWHGRVAMEVIGTKGTAHAEVQAGDCRSGTISASRVQYSVLAGGAVGTLGGAAYGEIACFLRCVEKGLPMDLPHRPQEAIDGLEVAHTLDSVCRRGKAGASVSATAAGCSALGTQSAYAVALAFVEHHRSNLLQLAVDLIRRAHTEPARQRRAAAEVATGAKAAWLSRYLDSGAAARARQPALHLAHRSPRQTLLLNGHLDTKPAGDLGLWRTDPWPGTVVDGRLYGLGAVNMKGPGPAPHLSAGSAATSHAAVPLRMLDSCAGTHGRRGGRGLMGARFPRPRKTAYAPSGARFCRAKRHFGALDQIPTKISPRLLRSPLFVVNGTQTHSSISDTLAMTNAAVRGCSPTHFSPEGIAAPAPPANRPLP